MIFVLGLQIWDLKLLLDLEKKESDRNLEIVTLMFMRKGSVLNSDSF